VFGIFSCDLLSVAMKLSHLEAVTNIPIIAAFAWLCYISKAIVLFRYTIYLCWYLFGGNMWDTYKAYDEKTTKS